MSDHDTLDLAPLLSDAERQELVLAHWRRGELTPLPLANALARRRPPAPLRPAAWLRQA
jgi:hypothetical protein